MKNIISIYFFKVCSKKHDLFKIFSLSFLTLILLLGNVYFLKAQNAYQLFYQDSTPLFKGDISFYDNT